MTRVETGAVMDILAAAYPRYYAGITGQRREQALTMWAAMFEPDDARLVCAAVKSFIESDEKGFPPVPGQIKAKIRLITSKDEMTEMEAWARVAKAIKNSVYGSKEEFDRLPPILQRIVHSPQQLKDWGQMDSETVHSVLASNFQRSYRAIAAREKEFEMLPPGVREAVEAMRLAEAKPERSHEPSTMPESVKKRLAEIIQEQEEQTGKCPERMPEPDSKQKRGLRAIPETATKLLAGFWQRKPVKSMPVNEPAQGENREEIIAILRGEQAETARMTKGAVHD